MKSSTLVAWLENGGVHSVTAIDAAAIDAVAKIVRAERTIKVGNKVVPVVIARVIRQNGKTCSVVSEIKCRRDAKMEKLASEAKGSVK